MAASHNCRNDDGYAVLTAVVALAILVLLASSMVMVSRLGITRARSDLEQSQAEAFADAILAQTCLALQDSRQDMRPRVDGVESDVNVMGVPESLKIEDEFGKVDLNAAPAVLLSRLFQIAGLSPAQADALAAAVDAWRRGGISERDKIDGTDGQSQRRYFRSVDELQLIPGITNELLRVTEPGLTVFSGHDQVDRTVAPYEALLATGAFTPEEAQAVIAARSSGEGDASTMAVIRGGKIMVGIDQRGWPFRIRCRFRFGGGVYNLDATVRLTGAVGSGYVVASYAFSAAGGSL